VGDDFVEEDRGGVRPEDDPLARASAPRRAPLPLPHPEHAVESLTGPSTDGLIFFASVLSSLMAGAGR